MSKKTELPRCRFCGSELQDTFVNLGMQPLCESYSGPDQLNQMEPFFPLHTCVCRNCFLVQLEEYVSPERIFAEYAYFSSYAETWLNDAKKHAEMIIDRLGLDGKSQAMEIGARYDEPTRKRSSTLWKVFPLKELSTGLPKVLSFQFSGAWALGLAVPENMTKVFLWQEWN